MRSAGEVLSSVMPYRAPELKEVARKYMFRGRRGGKRGVAPGLPAVVRNRAPSWRTVRTTTRVVVVPYRELAAPPPLTDKPPPPQVAIAQPVAPPSVAVPVPVPDAEAPPEQAIASQEELSQSTPAVSEEGDQQLVVAPPKTTACPSSASTCTSRSCLKRSPR